MTEAPRHDKRNDALWPGRGAGPLAGIRIVDFGQYIAGPLVAMMLADQGADVVRVDPPGGPLWNDPTNATLLRGRRSIELNLKDDLDRRRAASLVATADVVVENFRPGVMERLGVGATDCLRTAPHLIYCSIPGFGADDARAGIAAWEGVVMAAAGAYSLRSPVSPKPLTVFSPLTLASVFAALEAATAIAAALIARQRDGLGQQIETPMFDALFEASGALGMTAGRGDMSFVDFTPGWYECADGRHVNLISLWLRHYEAFVRAAGRSSWIEEGLLDYERIKTDPAVRAELKARLVALFKERPACEWEALGHAQGSTVAMARSLTEWMDEPHALESGSLADIDDPILGRVRSLGLAVRLSTSEDLVAAPRKISGSDTAAIIDLLDTLAGGTARRDGTDPHFTASASSAAPLAGLRVLDFTRVMAGPTAGRILAQFGADVVKVDSSKSDARAMSRLPIAHEYVNRGKRSIDLDLHSEDGRRAIEYLLADSDIVLDNFTLGVAERLGIDEASARRANPNIIYSYLNTYGRHGPWANARGYAELANTATGITVRSNAGKPIESGAHSLTFDLPRWPFTDYAGGVLAAFGVMLGVYARNATGAGISVETSLIRAAALEQVSYMIRGDAVTSNEPDGSIPGWSTTQRLYDTADGAVFLGARPERIDVLLDLLGISEPERLPEAIARRTSVDLSNLLSAADVGVHRVEAVSDLMVPGGIAAQRGLRLEDDTEAFGRVAMLGPIARLSRTPLVPGAFPTAFGTETAEVLMRARS